MTDCPVCGSVLQESISREISLTLKGAYSDTELEADDGESGTSTLVRTCDECGFSETSVLPDPDTEDST